MKKLFGTVETHYLDGFQYKYTQPWEDESGSTSVAAMKLRFLPTSEGYYDALLNLYVYNYVDHLGNVRLSYADSDRDGNIRSRDQRIRECSDGNCIEYFIPGEIVANNSYYPFGMLFDHNNQVYSSNAYKYKYNGKELQETGMYDYGARFYMPDIGRWGVVDPLAEIYRRHTPYNYTINNPIRFTDPDGRTINDPQSKKEAEHTQMGLNMRKSQLELQRSMIYSSATDKNGKVSLSKAQKKEIGNINSMVNEVNKSINDITDMINDKNNDYVFSNKSENGGFPETKRTSDGQITVYFDSYGDKVHEGRHGGQIARKEYDIDGIGSVVSGSFGASKEIDAYKAELSAVGQIIFKPYLDLSDLNNIYKVGLTETVTDINQLDNSFLQRLVDKPGLNQKLIYPPKTDKNYYAK